MANGKSDYDADRFAHGTGGRSDDDQIDPTTMMPGVVGGKRTVLPDTGGSGDAARAEGTTGAIGQMDFTGAPAGTTGAGGVSGGSSAGETYGGGAGGGGATTGGGAGAGTAKDDPGPQSIESTLAIYDDATPGGDLDTSGTGSASGAGSRGETDPAGDTAPNR